MVIATLNRTALSWLFAIVGAEYILRWLPVGTHTWERLVTPGELRAALDRAGLKWRDARGMIFNPLRDGWSLGDDTDVNYLATASKPAAATGASSSHSP